MKFNVFNIEWEISPVIKTEIGKIKEAVDSCDELQGTDDVVVSFSRDFNYESASCLFYEDGKQKRKFYYYKGPVGTEQVI